MERDDLWGQRSGENSGGFPKKKRKISDAEKSTRSVARLGKLSKKEKAKEICINLLGLARNITVISEERKVTCQKVQKQAARSQYLHQRAWVHGYPREGAVIQEDLESQTRWVEGKKKRSFKAGDTLPQLTSH